MDEKLMCPACNTTYDWGNECPDCGVQLVGESLAEACATTVPSRRIPGWLDVVMGLIGFVALLHGVDALD